MRCREERDMENQNIEYKATWRDEYLKWICGFANAQGGSLYIGINDEGEICGVSDARRLSEDIPNKIVSLLGIVCEVNLFRKKDKDYIEIIVTPSNVPISLKGVYHYRSGSTKQELNGIALQQFILKKMGRSWDDILCEQATINDMDRASIDYFLRKAVAAQRLPGESLEESTESVLKNLNLVDVDGRIKNSAVLLFAKKPQRFITGVYFKIGFFGTSENDLIFQDVVDGNILKMCDTVMELLKAKYLISPIHYEGLQRIEPLEIPEDALREAIFNAIIHKDYMGTDIQMKVWRDRIELWNYGKLPEELPVEKLLKPHASNARNKNIAFVFYKAGFIEAWGRGISKIVSRFTGAGLKKPVFEDFCGGVRVTLYRNTGLSQKTVAGNRSATGKTRQESDQKTAQKTAQKILSLLRNYPGITRAELAGKCGLSASGIKWQLKRLKDSGLIRRIGADKGGYWEIVE